ncbi:Cof-type HAD-IIB family hydrolase [Erysipelothrix anatis]|uniref:Cof-type HAD-IIB family hydrolase n=1 Tax=Erysipelothrix anatis TaxID=2683713 RepID=UPI00135ABC2F|nr:Cof-type HAD-IIB family hydrolase [Erysipelothrix anatis]
MKPKIIAFDIDGTTINNYRKVDRSTLNALIDLSKRGYILVPTTGRSLDGIPKPIRDLNICDYAISSNGARITNLRTMEDIDSDLMSTELAIKIVEIVKPYRVWTSLHINGECYDQSWFQKMGRRILFHNDFKSHPTVRDLSSFIKDNNYEVEKIQIFTLSHRKLKRVLSELEPLKCISYPMSANRYYEITQEGANKGRSLQILCEHLGLSMDDVFAIGDDSNDIAMLKIAGISVAMGNAHQAVRDAAQFQTEKNTEQGFAHAIYKYVISEDS